MARGLTIAAIAIALLILVLFGADLALNIFGTKDQDGRTTMMMVIDICFLVCGLGLGLLGISVWRELD